MIMSQLDQSHLSLPIDSSPSAFEAATPRGLLPQADQIETPASVGTSAVGPARSTDVHGEKSTFRRYSSESRLAGRQVDSTDYQNDAALVLRHELERVTKTSKEAEARLELRTQQLQVKSKCINTLYDNRLDGRNNGVLWRS